MRVRTYLKTSINLMRACHPCECVFDFHMKVTPLFPSMFPARLIVGSGECVITSVPTARAPWAPRPQYLDDHRDKMRWGKKKQLQGTVSRERYFQTIHFPNNSFPNNSFPNNSFPNIFISKHFHFQINDSRFIIYFFAVLMVRIGYLRDRHWRVLLVTSPCRARFTTPSSPILL